MISILLLSRWQPARLYTSISDQWPAQPLTTAGYLPGLLGTAFLLLLIATGFIGTTDPLRNPLPLGIWTLFWVVLVLLHALFGNLWHRINPWYAVLRALNGNDPRRLANGRLHLPAGIGTLPALLCLSAFAWFELVSLSPEDPRHLALMALLYWGVHLLLGWLFGVRWFRQGECFTIIFYLISLLATRQPNGGFNMPGSAIVNHPALPMGTVLLTLMTLASVSFDGLSRTFWWLHLNHINPLDFAGRSSVTGINTAGLIGAIALLSSLFLGSVWLGNRLAYKPVPFNRSAGTLAMAIIPISLAYHFAHYLTQVLVNSQYLLIAFSDPFASGLDLLGQSARHVTTSFLTHEHSVRHIWLVQMLAIVAGHLFSAWLGHLLSHRLYDTRRDALVSQIPLSALMVVYTWFGLWLLSTPTGA